MAQDAVTIDKRVGDLADDLGVGETNDKTVLGGLVLVLVLSTKSLALTVVGLSLTSTSELDLVSGKIRLALSNFDERLFLQKQAGAKSFVRYSIKSSTSHSLLSALFTSFLP